MNVKPSTRMAPESWATGIQNGSIHKGRIDGKEKDSLHGGLQGEGGKGTGGGRRQAGGKGCSDDEADSGADNGVRFRITS